MAKGWILARKVRQYTAASKIDGNLSLRLLSLLYHRTSCRLAFVLFPEVITASYMQAHSSESSDKENEELDDETAPYLSDDPRNPNGKSEDSRICKITVSPLLLKISVYFFIFRPQPEDREGSSKGQFPRRNKVNIVKI